MHDIEDSQLVQIQLIDSQPDLLLLLNSLEKHFGATFPTQPELFFRCEGHNFGQRGGVSVLTILVRPLNMVALIHVQQLGEAAFATSSQNGLSVETILESATIRKAAFDVRNVCNALYKLQQIAVSGMDDVQLMELVTRKGSKSWLAGLSGCVGEELDRDMEARWTRCKAIAKDDTHAYSKERSIAPSEQQYYAQDVIVLAELYDIYRRRLQPPSQAFWRSQVTTVTEDRIRQSRDEKYNSQAHSIARGP